MPLRRTSLPEQAADALAARLAAGEWPVGDPLPSEHALATELGVGRSTVREAVRLLAARGLVRARQGAGVFVTATVPVPDWELVLRRGRVADVVEARVAVEVQAARLAATRRTPDDVAALGAALAHRAAARDDPGPSSDECYVDADARLHAAVVAAAHNPVLVELFAAFAPRVREGMLELLALAGPGSVHHHDQDAHAAIVAAVTAGDPDAAARAASDHLQSMLDALAGSGAADPATTSPDPEETR